MPSPKNDCPECGRLKKFTARVCQQCHNAKSKADARVARIHKAGGAVDDTTVVAGDKAELSRISDQRVRTLADLIRVCEIDTNEWEVKRWVANKWEVGATDRNKTLHVKPLFQIKVWLERKVAVMDARAEIKALLDDVRNQLPMRPAPPIVRHVGESHHYMLEPHIPDLHLGKLAWGEETGHANYDNEIAQAVFKAALDTLIQRTCGFSFERVVFPIGSDFFNTDNIANTTTRGTAQDVDGRFQKTFRIGRALMTYAIDRLRQVAPQVDVVVVPGNHDKLSSWFLGEVLAAIYAKTPGVTIDNTPRTRKYIEYHRNMLLLTHGDGGKRQDYPLLMATEQHEMFGRTLHREAHTGHLHHKSVQEHHGVKVRISPALCPPDAWHAENAYFNARGAEAFCWHRTEGIVSIANYTVPQLASKSRKRAA